MPNHGYILMKDSILQTSEVNFCLPCEASHTTEVAFFVLGDILRNSAKSSMGNSVGERCAGLLRVKRECPPSVTSFRCLIHSSRMGKVQRNYMSFALCESWHAWARGLGYQLYEEISF